jgi:erythromycin esterase-like protein/predicted phosphoribosyltransferase
VELATRRFKDRAQAGRMLAEPLREYAGRDDVAVLAVTRGGAAVAAEVARALDAPLDLLLVRPLRVPGSDDRAIGAVASSGVVLIDKRAARELNLSLDEVEALTGAAVRELERDARRFRGDRPPPDVAGRTVILVDDGVVSGGRMRAAARAVRLQEPARVVTAVPVAPPDACAGLRGVADQVVCLLEPERVGAVSAWYEDSELPDEGQVRTLLGQAKPPPAVDVRRALRPLEDGYAELVERAAAADYVLIGGASHGTHEHYAERAELTKRLIAEAGFMAVAVEADWPDARRVDRFVRGVSGDRTPDDALTELGRFPAWMWRNTVVRDFVGWLRAHNDDHASKVGFYGLDLYSLHASIEAVLDYLEHVDPAAARRARERYACFDHAGRDPQTYRAAATFGGTEPCERGAVAVLMELRARRAEADSDDAFFAERNAALVVDAETYYREMFRSTRRSWNLREAHMADTLDALVAYLEREHEPVKVVVWAHNAHLGDARATEMGQRGERSLGQLVRTRHGGDALLVGLTTYDGTLTAAVDWDRPAQRQNVRRALPGSWEELFHEAGVERALIDARNLPGLRLERAIGVIYRPESERISHYFTARLSAQFDAVLHLDRTTALEALQPSGARRRGDVPETYPWGL